MSPIPSILSEDQWLALDAGFAEILGEIPKPVTPEHIARLREATPLTFIKPRELPEGRDDFTRESEALI